MPRKRNKRKQRRWAAEFRYRNRHYIRDAQNEKNFRFAEWGKRHPHYLSEHFTDLSIVSIGHMENPMFFVAIGDKRHTEKLNEPLPRW